jgi:N-acetylmuramic acid 6-phosphate (MurNAc-6-P) etherase
VEWSAAEARQLVPPDKLARTMEILHKISRPELLRFKIGLDGLRHRAPIVGDSAIAVMDRTENPAFYRTQLANANAAGAATGLLCFSREPLAGAPLPFPATVAVSVKVPKTDFLLDGVTRVAVKLVMNALSTCTMVRLGRVMGNCMIWVVPSNLKLIDRATRYIGQLTGLAYEPANQLLFEVIEYVEPRMKTDQAYPPVVALAVLRAREGLTNEQAEQKLPVEP